MKGVTFKTYLPPYPPQNLQCYPSDTIVNRATSVKITWTTPRGEFHKYSLRIVLLGSSGDILRTMSTRENLLLQRNQSVKMPDEIWLPKDVNEHTAENLKPGERYQIEIKSMTEFHKCRDEKAPKAVVLTRPLPPSKISAVASDQEVRVKWSPPEGEGHSCLAGYCVRVRLKQGAKPVDEVFVHKCDDREILFSGLMSTVEYELVCIAICKNSTKTKTVPNILISQATEIKSDEAIVGFVTQPRPPLNVRLDSAGASSLRVRWDPPSDTGSAKPSFSLTIQPLDKEVAEQFGEEFIKEVDSNIFTFSKLPEIIGSGQKYEVAIRTSVNIGGKVFQSEAVKKIFMTKPLPPEQIEISNSNCDEFSWKRSQTRGVTKYKFRVKKNDEKPVDYCVDDNIIQEEGSDDGESQLISFRVPTKFEEGSEYKINIFSLLEMDGKVLESDPCQARVARVFENSEVDMCFFQPFINNRQYSRCPIK